MGFVNGHRRSLSEGRLCAVLLVPVLLSTTACMHRPIKVVETYRLEDSDANPLLVPSRSANTTNEAFQTASVDLGAVPGDLSRDANIRCSIEGAFFSLRPPDRAASAIWRVTSPSEHEWEAQTLPIDLVTEWAQFRRKLLSLQRTGCFASGWEQTKVVRTIAEAIPIPTSESLLFYYSYNGKGAVDLAPGMQVRVERSVLGDHDGLQTVSSIEAQYEVIPSSGTGVALRLSGTANRHLSKATANEDANMFDLVRLTQTATMFRLFLQTVTDKDVKRKAMLLASSSAEGLDEAMRQIGVDASSGCETVKVNGTSCITFESGISLLISCRVNGKLTSKPLGTTVNQVIKDKQSALNSLILIRHMAGGGYAAVDFPRTLEAAREVILLNGDRISWGD